MAASTTGAICASRPSSKAGSAPDRSATAQASRRTGRATLWIIDGLRLTAHGLRLTGRTVSGVGRWALGVGLWALGVGLWALGVGSWELALRVFVLSQPRLRAHPVL